MCMQAPRIISHRRSSVSRGDLYVHQAERDQGGSVKNWNVILDSTQRPRAADRNSIVPRRGSGVSRTDLGHHLVEHYKYTPYGELTVDQDEGDQGGSLNSYGDRDGDGIVNSTDKGTVGVTCTGTVSGACRILDLDFDGEYDSSDATKFDSLPSGSQK